MAAPQQQAFAWGVYSATLGDQDPLLLAWCDVGNLAVWSAEVNNQAGSFKLSSGSLIVAGTWVGLTAIIWTDLDMWVANYIGFPLIYSFNRVAQNCGLIAPKAWGVLGNMVAWMGQYDFFVYEGGSVRPVPCTVRDYVFNTIDRGNVSSVHCDVNTAGNEIMWRFPQGHLSGGVCTAYVKWSPAENSWDFGEGPPNLSAWADISGWHYQDGGSYPLGIDYSGNILVFETDYDFPLSTVDIFYITGWFYIAEGQEMVTVERVNPDFVFNPEQGFVTPSSGAVNMTFYFADEIPATETDYPVRTYGPYLVTDQTPYIIVRGRGRVMQIRVDVVQGSFFRNGKHMARISIDGHR